MPSVTILKKDGTRQEFPDTGRPGGSYTNSVRYEGVFVIVTDAYRNQTAIPAQDVAEVKVSGDYRSW